MRKLKLGMDALKVETFETLSLPWREFGTVQARQAAGNPAFAADTDASNCATCDTCVGDNCNCKCNQSTVA